MTQFLPPSLLLLFAPRDPLPYAAPLEKRKMPSYSGIGTFTGHFETPQEVDYINCTRTEWREERRERIQKERTEECQARISEQTKNWNPNADEKATGDPFKTLFVARLNYDTTESKLKREFEIYGPIRKIRIVRDNEGKPRGYAFIEYDRERDMRTAYKQADGKRIDDRRILVDAERGRTSQGWKPRRLGGGAGHARSGQENRPIITTPLGPPRRGGDRYGRSDDRGPPRYPGPERRSDSRRSDREQDRDIRSERTERRYSPYHSRR